MADKVSDAVQVLATILGTVLERITSLFEVFDFSFLISGSMAVGAILVTANLLGAPMPEVTIFSLAAGLGIAYLLGLMCFAVGRSVRERADIWIARPRVAAVRRWMKLRRPPTRAELMESAGRVHGLEETEAFRRYFTSADERRMDRLYTRLWAEARQRSELAESLKLIKRYWVLAATYDGLSAGLWLWVPAAAFPLSAWLTAWWWPEASRTSGGVLVVVCVLVVLLTLLLCRTFVAQAWSYREYQLEELAATVAYWLNVEQKGASAANLARAEVKEKEAAARLKELEGEEKQEAVLKSRAEREEAVRLAPVRFRVEEAGVLEASAKAEKAKADADFRRKDVEHYRPQP